MNLLHWQRFLHKWQCSFLFISSPRSRHDQRLLFCTCLFRNPGSWYSGPEHVRGVLWSWYFLCCRRFRQFPEDLLVPSSWHRCRLPFCIPEVQLHTHTSQVLWGHNDEVSGHVTNISQHNQEVWQASTWTEDTGSVYAGGLPLPEHPGCHARDGRLWREHVLPTVQTPA